MLHQLFLSKLSSVFHGNLAITQSCNKIPYKPVSSERYKLACASAEDSDQPAHPRSLIRVFGGRLCVAKGAFIRHNTKTLIRLCGCADRFESSVCIVTNL